MRIWGFKLVLLKLIPSNGFLLLIPILIWNFTLYKYLPSVYDPEKFDEGIPGFILAGENLFRMLIFIMPFFIKMNYSSSSGRIGMVVFVLGVLIYFISWILIIKFPGSWWFKSIVGFSAPAFTIIIWLIGFTLMTGSFYFEFRYSKWFYLIPSVLMILFHTTHSYLVYLKNVK